MQVEQQVDDRGQRGLHVFQANVFAGLVGEAARRAEEEHGGGDGGGEDHGVVAGAGEDGLGVEAGAGGGLVQMVGEVAVHEHGALLGLHHGVDLHAAQGGRRLGLREQVRDGRVAGLVLGVADVERGADGAGHDVDRAGMRGNAADRRDQLRVVGGVALHFDDPLRGGGERVAAQRHGGGAGVVGLAGEGELEARLADDGFDDGERGIALFEDRTLLDVDLDSREGVGREGAGDGDAVGVEAEVADGVGDGNAFGVGAGEMLGRELAGGGQRGEKGKAEANALFFREGDELDVEGQRCGAELLDGSEAEQNAQRAVEGSGVEDGVDVREEDEGGCVRGAQSDAQPAGCRRRRCGLRARPGGSTR